MGILGYLLVLEGPKLLIMDSAWQKFIGTFENLEKYDQSLIAYAYKKNMLSINPLLPNDHYTYYMIALLSCPTNIE